MTLSCYPPILNYYNSISICCTNIVHVYCIITLHLNEHQIISYGTLALEITVLHISGGPLFTIGLTSHYHTMIECNGQPPGYNELYSVSAMQHFKQAFKVQKSSYMFIKYVFIKS